MDINSHFGLYTKNVGIARVLLKFFVKFYAAVVKIFHGRSENCVFAPDKSQLTFYRRVGDGNIAYIFIFTLDSGQPCCNHNAVVFGNHLVSESIVAYHHNLRLEAGLFKKLIDELLQAGFVVQIDERFIGAFAQVNGLAAGQRMIFVYKQNHVVVIESLIGCFALIHVFYTVDCAKVQVDFAVKEVADEM